MLSLTDDSVIRILHQIQSEVARCRLIKTHFSTLVYILAAELDSSSSSLSQWMIKQRDWGNSCGGELWHFYPLHRHRHHPPPSPTATSNAAVSASRRKERRETKAIRDVHKRGGAPVTWRSLSEKTSTPRNAEKLPAAGLHLHWTH